MRRYLFAFLSLSVLGFAGCQHRQRQAPCPPAPCPPPGQRVVMPPPGPRPINQGQLPPGAVLNPPPGAVIVPQGGVAPNNVPPGGSPSPVVPPPLPPGSSLTPNPAAPPFPPGANRVESAWQPVEARTPDTAKSGGDLRNSVLLYPPEITDKPGQTAEPPVGDKNPAKSPEKKQTTLLPAGIPQFESVKKDLTTGLRPALDDGLDWLAANGYKTVLALKAPGEDDAADRQQVEKRGMKYVTLDVSPATLTREQIDDFLNIVRESKQPMFVYDRDGSLAGGMWYAYFRLVEQYPDDVSRIRAASVGLREEREGSHRDMWRAVQGILKPR